MLQRQPTDGRQLCKNGCRGRGERRIQEFESTDHQTTNCDASEQAAGEAENDKTKKAKEKVVERREVEVSNAKLEHETCRHCEESGVSVESVSQH